MLFNSVSDSLFAHARQVERDQIMGRVQAEEPIAASEARAGRLPTVTDFQKFQISLTLEYEFDYLEVYTPMEVVEFLKEMHFSIVDKPYRKELSMYSRKGFRPGKKAQMQGFKDNLSLTYISFLMCIPGVSENKAIAIAKTYPTVDSLMKLLSNKSITEKQRKATLADVEIRGIGGEKSKKVGKAIAEKIYTHFMAVDPSIIIS